jgi:uncharacterized membrane protein
VVTITVTVPIGAPAAELPLLVDVSAGGSEDTGQIDLTVLPDVPVPPAEAGAPGPYLSLGPETAVGGPGATTVYTVMVSNLGDMPDTYDLTVDVPAGWERELWRNGTAVSSVSYPAGRTTPSNCACW